MQYNLTDATERSILPCNTSDFEVMTVAQEDSWGELADDNLTPANFKQRKQCLNLVLQEIFKVDFFIANPNVRIANSGAQLT